MSRPTSIRAALLIAFLTALLALPFFAAAAEIRTGDQPSLGTDERFAENVYIAGGTITSSGVATRDLIAAGGSILVRGAVGGDMLGAGGSITLLGNVADDVRLAGGNIVVSGGVGGDAMLFGGQINVSGAGVQGDLIAGGGTIRVDAPISGRTRIGGGDVYLNSTIRGDVEIFAEKLTLGRSARVEGNLSYTAAAEATQEEGARVAGETNFTKKPRTISVTGAAKVISLALLVSFLSQLAAGLLFGLVFKRFVLALVEGSVARPLLEVGRGLVVLIVLPVLSFLLLFTYIGIPLALLGIALFFTTILYLWIATPVILGSLAYRSFFGGDFDVNWKTILLGAVIYNILGLIPIVGWLTQFILMLLALGITVKLKWEIAKEWR